MTSKNNNNSSDPVRNDLPEYSEGHSEAPPDYDTLIQIPDHASVPAPSHYEDPKLEGLPDEPAPEYSEAVRSDASPHLPRLAYADFLPSTRHHPSHIHPVYDDFKTLMWIVNDWLSKNAHFRVLKVECIKRKIGKNGEKETETTIYHSSAFGHNNYVLGVRLWLVPNTQRLPPQQLWYVNVVPKGELTMVAPYACIGMAAGPNAHIIIGGRGHRGFGYGQIMYPQFEDLDQVLNKVNTNFKQHPLPGEILNVETVEIKHENQWKPGCVNPDNCFWNEKGSDYHLYLHILKIFFVLGQPREQQIGVMDFVPTCTSTSTSALGKPKFEAFSTVVADASRWIGERKDVCVKNVQTLEMKMQRDLSAPSGYKLDTKSMDYNQGYECLFVRVIRCVYVNQQSSVPPPPSLGMKIFVPVRTGYREAETMSITMARVNHWLSCVGNRVLGVDTIKFPITAERMNEVRTEESSYLTHTMRATYWMTVIRLYLEGDVIEPPLEVYCPPPPVVQKTSGESECCAIA